MTQELPGADPRYEKLMQTIRNLLKNPDNSLLDVLDQIVSNSMDTDLSLDDDEENFEDYITSDAMALSINAIDKIIEELAVTEINYKRLREYISEYPSIEAYTRLITDFRKFMDEETIEQLIEDGNLFGEELDDDVDDMDDA